MNELARRLCICARDGASGALQWQDGAKKRIFYFEAGALVLAQSNLKSESIERLLEQSPMDNAAARKAIFRLRVEAAFGERGGDVSFGPAILPNQEEPIDLLGIALDRAAKTLSPDCFPRATSSCAAWVAALPLDSALQTYLRDLDGTRPIEDVLHFGPAEPAKLDRVLRFLVDVGGVEDAGGEAQGYVVRMVGPRSGSTAGAEDIAAMIRGTLDPSITPVPRAPSDPVEAFFGPVLRRIRGAADHFAVLGVSWRDPPETIRRAYLTLARELHPDRFAGEPDLIRQAAEDLFEKVRAAWEMLGEDSKREAYIAKVIRGEKTEEELAMEKVKAVLEAEGAFKRALNEYYAGRIAPAHELFKLAAERVPDEAEYAAYHGYTTWRLNYGKDERAADEGLGRIHDAVKQNEKLDAGYVLLGLVQRQLGDEAAAKKSFVQALRIRPANPDAARELKRLEAKAAAQPPPEAAGGLLSRLFKRTR